MDKPLAVVFEDRLDITRSENELIIKAKCNLDLYLKKGLLDEKLNPLKCPVRNSNNLLRVSNTYDREGNIESYTAYCKDCYIKIGDWSIFL